MEEGYYGSSTVSTDPSPLPAKIEYTHHVHSLSSRTSTVTDENPLHSGYGSETSTSQGGCYQSSNQHQCTGYVHENVQQMTNHGMDWTGFCNVCGHEDNSLQPNETARCRRMIGSGYSTTCGYKSGQIISATITY